MTRERMAELAEELHDKAIQIADGFYGDSETEEDGDGVDIEEWHDDVERAATCLKEGRPEDLGRQELEEIECCCVLDDGDMEELRELAGVNRG